MSQGFEIKLANNVDQTYAQQLLEEILANMDAQSSFTINASAVERIGTPGAQVLMAFHQYCREHNLKIKIEKPSQQFKSAFQDLGLDEYVQEWGL
jgi:anti-anti-sigma regulatory factor